VLVEAIKIYLEWKEQNNNSESFEKSTVWIINIYYLYYLINLPKIKFTYKIYIYINK